VTVEALTETIRATAGCPVHLVKRLEDLPDAVARLSRSGDLVVTLGAGSIGGVGDEILAAISGTRHRAPADAGGEGA
jgi:UDP-N-acetylmuramate--alanine ligase